MADNVPITAGSGTTIATDDAGAGGHVQVVKLAISTDGSATYIPANATEGLEVYNNRPAVATLANVASSATSVTLQASNVNRRGWMIHNDSTQVLFVKFGTTASNTSYTVKMAAGDYYEMPHPCYTGRIDGIWAAANGFARVTEITP